MTDQHGASTGQPADGPTGAAGARQYDVKGALAGAHRYDLGIVVAGVVAFLASMLPFYTVSVGIGGVGASGSASAWHGFFGWFAVLVALAAAVAVALSLLDAVDLPMPVHQVAVGAFGLSLVCLVLALFVDPAGCGGAAAFVHCDIGRGIGYWVALLAVAAGACLAAMRLRETADAPAGS